MDWVRLLTLRNFRSASLITDNADLWNASVKNKAVRLVSHILLVTKVDGTRFFFSRFVYPSFTQKSALYTLTKRLSRLFQLSFTKDCSLSLWTSPYVHDNSCIFESDSIVTTQHCTKATLTLKIAVSTKETVCKTFIFDSGKQHSLQKVKMKFGVQLPDVIKKRFKLKPTYGDLILSCAPDFGWNYGIYLELQRK